MIQNQFKIVHSLRSNKHEMNLIKQMKQPFFNNYDKCGILSVEVTSTLLYHIIMKNKMNIIRNLKEINEKYETNVTDMKIYNVKIRYRTT